MQHQSAGLAHAGRCRTRMPFSWRGNSNICGELTGVILGLKDLEMTLRGNVTINFNRSNANPAPAGFNHPMGLTSVPNSYKEGL